MKKPPPGCRLIDRLLERYFKSDTTQGVVRHVLLQEGAIGVRDAVEELLERDAVRRLDAPDLHG